jgi:hypothetical protein
MNVNLTPDQAKAAKEIFSKYQEVNDRKKELSAEEKGLKENLSKIIEGSVGDAGKVLKAMLVMFEDGENPLDDICNVIDVIKNDGAE